MDIDLSLLHSGTVPEVNITNTYTLTKEYYENTGVLELRNIEVEGKVYRGCNIENAAYSPTNCAERTAFFKAVSEGEREFAAIAVVGGPAGNPPLDYCYPCGVCRQVMAEFCADDFVVLIGKSEEEFREHTLADILPHTFREPDLHK